MCGLIWITGHSSSGKTTVASLVTAKLKSTNIPVIMLDGDELRSILGDTAGYSLQERKKLAFIYSRFCKKIVDSGITVVIATVAMFDAVRKENRLSISNYYEVYLKVPIEVRIKRDPKGLYMSRINESESNIEIEEPKYPDITLHNYGDTTPETAASKIFNGYLNNKINSRVNQEIDLNIDHWDSFYQKRKAPINPSTFAIFCNQNYIEPASTILEVGCGNGRDSFYLARNHNVIGLDISEKAISINTSKAIDENLSNLVFFHGDIGSFYPPSNAKINIIYSRFTLHAMPEEDEDLLLMRSYNLLNKNGKLLLEFRTTKDPMMQQGKIISKFERVTDHYRRYIDYSVFIEKLTQAGFRVEFSLESNGLAQYGNEDPVVARIIATKISSHTDFVPHDNRK